MVEAVINQRPTVEVPCGFCRGTGKDPFGIMSWLSACCVCLGQGTAKVEAPYQRCAHCHGTGAIKTFTCTSCRGKGVLPALEGPTEVCPLCGGSGDDGSVPTLDCLKCRGRGLIAAVAPDANGNTSLAPTPLPQGEGQR